MTVICEVPANPSHSVIRVKQRQRDGERNRNMSSARVRNNPATQLCSSVPVLFSCASSLPQLPIITLQLIFGFTDLF